MTQRIAIENYASVGILLINNDGNFSFSSAAHYPLQILRSGAESYEQIQTGGMPVGIDKNAEYQQVDGVLAPDDLVLFHTDGVPEAGTGMGKCSVWNDFLKPFGTRHSHRPKKSSKTCGGSSSFSSGTPPRRTIRP